MRTWARQGVGRDGQPFVGFDYSALDKPEFLGDPSFRRFIQVIDSMAEGMALHIVVMILTNHSTEQIKAFVMHIHGLRDREIGRRLNIDHHTSKKWHEGVKDTIRRHSPMGSEPEQAGMPFQHKDSPTHTIDRRSSHH